MRRKGVLVGVLSVLLAAVSVSGENRLEKQRDNPLPVIDQVQEHYRLYDLEGRTLSDGTISVTISGKDGVPVFESRFIQKADGKYIEWEYRGETPYSMSRKVDRNTIRTVQGMTTMAKDIVRVIRRGRINPDQSTWKHAGTDALKAKMKVDDNWGCDWPFDDLSCTPAGHCCDEHDNCYAIFNCDALSWLGLESVYCQGCNVVLAACVVDASSGAGLSGMPSECCFQNNCGTPRTGVYFGDIGGGGGSEHTGPDNQYSSDPGGSGGGGGWTWIGYTPWGSIGIGGGTCTFPDGTVLPCG